MIFFTISEKKKAERETKIRERAHAKATKAQEKNRNKSARKEKNHNKDIDDMEKCIDETLFFYPIIGVLNAIETEIAKSNL